MVTSVTSTTLSSSYYDDFNDSDNFKRILFNPGKGVQARELTQLQTILGNEIKKLSNYLFDNGAIVSQEGGSLATRTIALGYVILTSNPSDIADFVGVELTGGTSGKKARVKYALTAAEATAFAGSSTNCTLLVEYTDGGSSANQAFSNAENLTGGPTSPVVVSSTGLGSGIEMPDLDIYYDGHYIKVPAQSIVLDPFNDKPTETIAYKVVEEIVSVTDDQRLYDNSGPSLNTAQPGADRYRIRLILSKLSDKSGAETFLNVLNVRNGVLSALVTPDNQTSLMGDLIAQRTRDISGNFIPRSSIGTLAVTLQDDSADAGYYVVKVDPGTAFVDGYRIQKTKDSYIRVKKPRVYDGTTNDDVTEITNEQVRFSLGNYFLCNDLGGSIVSKIGAANPQLYILDSANDKIGTVAILGMDKFFSGDTNSFDYKVNISNLVMFDSDSRWQGAGKIRDISDARSLSVDGTTAESPILAVQNSYAPQDRLNTSLLFPLPKSRPYSLTTISGVRAYAGNSGTSSGSGTLTVNSSGLNNLSNEDNWIFVNTTDDTVTEGWSVSGAITTSANITGLEISKNYEVLVFEEHTYTASTGRGVLNTSIALTPGNFYTDPYTGLQFRNITNAHDVIKINSVTDTGTSEDISEFFNVVRLTTDAIGSGSKIVAKQGYTIPANISIDYDYYNNSYSSDQVRTFSSYSGNLEDKPSFRTRLGENLPLEDYLDFRVRGGITGGVSSSGFGPSTTYDFINNSGKGLPLHNSIIDINTAEYYQPRVDQVFMNRDGIIKVREGQTDVVAKVPEIEPGSILLASIYLNPYMKNKKDAYMVRPKNTGYKMTDIRGLERRISNLEEVTTLTMSELATKELKVTDPSTGLERDKIGLAVDKFNKNTQSAIGGVEYRAIIAKDGQTVGPQIFQHHVKFTYDNAASSNTVQYGDMVWPAYTEVVDSDLSQLEVTGSINVNSFTLNMFRGSGNLTPTNDNWSRSVILDTQEGQEIRHQGNQSESADPYWKQLGYSNYQAFIRDRT